MLLGSVSEYLTTHAHCPVDVVREGTEGEPSPAHDGLRDVRLCPRPAMGARVEAVPGASLTHADRDGRRNGGEPVGTAPSAQTRRRRRRPTLAWLIGLGIGLGIVYASISSAGDFSAALGRLGSSRLGWVVAGLGAEALSFVALGTLLHLLLGAGRTSRGLAARTGLVLAGLGNILPASPAEGITLAAAELRRRGVSGRRVVVGLGLSQWYTIGAALGLVAVNALVVALVVQSRIGGGRFAHLWMIGAPAVAVLVVIALSGWLARRQATAEWLAVVVGRARFWRRPRSVAQLRATGARWWFELGRVLNRPTRRRKSVVLAVGAIGFDVVCFSFSLLAVGVHPRPGALLVVYGAIVVSTLIPLLPAGLGAVETLVPALLHHLGTPLATGLAAVLVYRLLSTFLPAIAGALAYLHLRFTLGRPRTGAIPSSGSARNGSHPGL